MRALLRIRLLEPKLLVVVVVVLITSIPQLRAERAKRSITIDSSVTILESPDEPAPVRRATEDLVSDFSKVFGQQPATSDHLEDSGQVAIVISGPRIPDFAARSRSVPASNRQSIRSADPHR